MRKLVSTKIVGVICLLLMVSCKEVPQMVGNSTYKVMEVKAENRVLASKYSAAIKGKQSVEIRPQVNGTIMQVCISEGAKVKKNQTLFIIDQVPYKAALMTALANVESAKAGVATAQLTVDSKEELFKNNVISDFDLQTAKNALAVQKAVLSQAKAQELTARNNLSYTEVKSPVDGAASMIPYRVGALVSASIATPLVTVSDDDQMYAYFSMSEKQILSITRKSGSMNEAMKSMAEVELLLSDGSIYSEKGCVDAISGMIDPTTGSVSLKATFPNTNRILLSGGAGNVVIPYNMENCIVIPQAATYELQDKMFVYKVVDGKSVSTQVTAFPINDGKEYIIESGLQIGDTIVAEGAGLLREGVTITVAQQQQ